MGQLGQRHDERRPKTVSVNEQCGGGWAGSFHSLFGEERWDSMGYGINGLGELGNGNDEQRQPPD